MNEIDSIAQISQDNSFINISNFSSFSIVWIGAIALLIFILLRVINIFIPFLAKRTRFGKYLVQYWPAFEIFIWLGFIVLGLMYLLKRNPYYALGLGLFLLAIVLFFSFFLLKDYFAGIVVKIEGVLKIDDKVSIGNNIKGKVIKMGIRRVLLETDFGEEIYIPYSNIYKKEITKITVSEMLTASLVKIEMTKTDDIEAQLEKVKYFVASLPWVSIKKETKLNILEENDESIQIELSIFALEHEYLYKIKNALAKKYKIL